MNIWVVFLQTKQIMKAKGQARGNIFLKKKQLIKISNDKSSQKDFRNILIYLKVTNILGKFQN